MACREQMTLLRHQYSLQYADFHPSAVFAVGFVRRDAAIDLLANCELPGGRAEGNRGISICWGKR